MALEWKEWCRRKDEPRLCCCVSQAPAVWYSSVLRLEIGVMGAAPPSSFSPSALLPLVTSLLLWLSLSSCHHPTPPPPSHHFLSYFCLSFPHSRLFCLLCLSHQPLLQPLSCSEGVGVQPVYHCPAETTNNRTCPYYLLSSACFALRGTQLRDC